MQTLKDVIDALETQKKAIVAALEALRGPSEEPIHEVVVPMRGMSEEARRSVVPFGSGGRNIKMLACTLDHVLRCEPCCTEQQMHTWLRAKP